MGRSPRETLAVRESAPSLVVPLAPLRKRKNPNTSRLTPILPARKKGSPRRGPAAPPATLRTRGPKREKLGRREKGQNLARAEGRPTGRIKSVPRKSPARRIHRVTLIRVSSFPQCQVSCWLTFPL